MPKKSKSEALSERIVEECRKQGFTIEDVELLVMYIELTIKEAKLKVEETTLI